MRSNLTTLSCSIPDSLMGSDCEEDDEDEDPIRPPLNSGHLGSNGPESVGHLGASDLSVQSMSTDSKNNDDSDQVRTTDFFKPRDYQYAQFRVHLMAIPTHEVIHSLKTKAPKMVAVQSDVDREQLSKPNN